MVIRMIKPLITVITPTTGSDGLSKLFDSLDEQSVPWVHILLWDDKREDSYLYPDPETMEIKDPYRIECSKEGCFRYSIVMPGTMVQGKACGSALRSVGLMAANTPYVTFADSDVWYEPNHFLSLLEAIQDKQWAYCVRKIWSPTNGEYIGEDRFESIGDASKLPYNLVDNNSLLVVRKFAASSACIYRETVDYNDDRLMYEFLKKYAGKPGETGIATVNQVCPDRLEAMFRKHCS